MNQLAHINNSNITKISEEALILAYNSLKDPGSDMGILIESEFTRRDRVYEEARERAHKEKINKLISMHQIESEIEQLFQTYRNGRMTFLITKLGGQFEGDYVLDEQNNTITSLVADRCSFSVNSKWTYETWEEVVHQFRLLLYYRIYDHYVRNASQDSLDELKRSLGV